MIALSGGPGDAHRSLRPVVEPLASQFRWILYDQRGISIPVKTTTVRCMAPTILLCHSVEGILRA